MQAWREWEEEVIQLASCSPHDDSQQVIVDVAFLFTSAAAPIILHQNQYIFHDKSKKREKLTKNIIFHSSFFLLSSSSHSSYCAIPRLLKEKTEYLWFLRCVAAVQHARFWFPFEIRRSDYWSARPDKHV